MARAGQRLAAQPGRDRRGCAWIRGEAGIGKTRGAEETEPAAVGESTLRRALALARVQNSRALERRILASPAARSIREAMLAFLTRRETAASTERFRERFRNGWSHRLSSQEDSL